MTTLAVSERLPIGALSEHELISGHGGLLMRREPCACGGLLIAPLAADDTVIMATVRAHNETVRHRVWRQRREER